MIYLESFSFPSIKKEDYFLADYYKKNPYGPQSHYPFEVLSLRGLSRLDFSEVTVLYGGNGSGKSTALNIIANKLNLARSSAYNKKNRALSHLVLLLYGA